MTPLDAVVDALPDLGKRIQTTLQHNHEHNLATDRRYDKQLKEIEYYKLCALASIAVSLQKIAEKGNTNETQRQAG